MTLRSKFWKACLKGLLRVEISSITLFLSIEAFFFYLIFNLLATQTSYRIQRMIEIKKLTLLQILDKVLQKTDLGMSYQQTQVKATAWCSLPCQPKKSIGATRWWFSSFSFNLHLYQTVQVVESGWIGGIHIFQSLPIKSERYRIRTNHMIPTYNC